MSAPTISDEKLEELATRVGELAQQREVTVATAESLTGGHIAQTLAATSGSGEWFAGSVVAYLEATKRAALKVTAEHIVSAPSAEQMAAGVCALTGADAAVAVTGVGGPDPQDEQEPGTVFIAVADADRVESREHDFEGDPEEIVRQTVAEALRMLAARLAGD